MKVTLRYHMEDALNILLETKNTRLTFIEPPAEWPAEKKAEHLAYMRDTIKSSWEFIDYIFSIEVVTRVFTHQLVRTRTGSYAQQTQRATDVREQPIMEPSSIANDQHRHELWTRGVAAMIEAYSGLIDAGTPIQDARGMMPVHTTTSIMCKYNLRTLHDMAKLRLCTRTQGEYQEVFRRMRELVVGVHPWTEDFINVHCVSEGTCAFPRYGKEECPVYLPAMDLTEVKAQAKVLFWSTRHEAAPVSKHGKSM